MRGRNTDYAALFSATPCPCLVITPDLIIVEVNQAYLNVTGRERKELLGRYFFDVFPANPGDPESGGGARMLTDRVRRVVATGEPDVIALRKHDISVVGSPGVYEERYWSSILSPVPGQDDTVGLLIHRVEDVTAFVRESRRNWPQRPVPGGEQGERVAAMEAELYARAKDLQELNEQLRQERTLTEQALDRQRQFAVDASHELRTPVTGLRVLLEEAQLHPDDIDLRDLLDHALGDLDRLQSIITDLLLLARLGEDAQWALEEVDLSVLVEAEVARRVDRHEVRLRLDAGVRVNAVPTQIARVITNLLDNAQRHARQTVWINLRRTGGRAELTVTDDGQGIVPADRERIFQRFVRLEASRSRDHGGTGLGLAIARDIARTHYGSLHVEDSADSGARFVLRIPACRKPIHRL